MTKTKKMAFFGISVAAAIILSYVEVLLPPILTAVPGIKIGLANIVIVFLLYRLSFREAVFVSLIRLVVITMLFGSALTFIYSFFGAALSLMIMWLLKKITVFSTVGVSVCGAVCHNLGQIIVAIFLMKTVEIGYYMIVLAISGTLSGVVIGLIGGLLLKYTNKLKI